MKKFRCISMMLAVVLSSLLISCGDSSVIYESESNSDSGNVEIDKKEPVTITVWHYYNGVQQMNFDNAVKEFNNTVGRDEGIIVEAYSKDSISDLSNNIISSVKGSSGSEAPPDIVTVYAETAYTLDKMNALANIDKYFTDDEISEYVDEYIDEGRFSADNSIKIFPTAKSTEIMILNYTDWEEFAEAEDVDITALETWEGVAETAEKYYNYTDALTPDTENDGRAFFGRDSVANYMIIGAKQLGAEFITLDNTGNPVLNIDKEAVKRLWENYYVPYVKGYYTMQGRYRSDDVKLGKSIAIICSTTGTAYYPTEVTIDDDYTYSIENTILQVPNFKDTEPYAVQQGAGMAVIASDEKSENASAVFLKWFTEEERNIEFSINSGYLPVKKSANDSDKISAVNENSESNVNDTMLDSLKTAIDEVRNYNLYTMKPFETAEEVRDYLGNYIQETADNAHSEVLAKISEGISLDEAAADYISDEAFEIWFNEFSTSMENMVK